MIGVEKGKAGMRLSVQMNGSTCKIWYIGV